jgi:hypothetical protein
MTLTNPEQTLDILFGDPIGYASREHTHNKRYWSSLRDIQALTPLDVRSIRPETHRALIAILSRKVVSAFSKPSFWSPLHRSKYVAGAQNLETALDQYKKDYNIYDLIGYCSARLKLVDEPLMDQLLNSCLYVIDYNDYLQNLYAARKLLLPLGKITATLALRELGDRGEVVINALLKVLHGKAEFTNANHYSARSCAAMALGELGGASRIALPDLMTLSRPRLGFWFSHENVMANYALARIGATPERALHSLLHAQSWGDKIAKKAAREALERLRQDHLL